jgi:hypothetical protein
MILNINENEQIIKHDDPTLTYRDRRQCQIFQNNNIDRQVRSDTFADSSQDELSVTLDTINREITVTSTDGYQFNNRLIFGFLLLNTEEGQTKLSLQDDVYADPETTPITTIKYKWSDTINNASIQGYNIFTMRLAVAEGGRFPYYDDAFYVVKMRLFRITSTSTSCTSYTLSALGGDDLTLTRKSYRDDISAGSGVCSYTFTVGGSDSSSEYRYRILVCVGTDYVSTSRNRYYTIGEGSYYGDALSLKGSNEVYFGKYYSSYSSGETTDCYFVLLAVKQGKDLDSINEVPVLCFANINGKVKSRSYVNRSEQNEGISNTQVENEVNIKERILSGRGHSEAGTNGFSSGVVSYTEPLYISSVDYGYVYSQWLMGRNYVPYYEVAFEQFEKSRMYQDQNINIDYINTSTWHHNIELSFSEDVSRDSSFFTSVATASSNRSYFYGYVERNSETNLNTIVIKGLGSVSSSGKIGYRGFFLPYFLVQEWRGGNSAYVREFKKKHGVSFSLVKTLKRGGAYLYNLKDILKTKYLKTLFEKAGDQLNTIYNHYVEIIENSYWIKEDALRRKCLGNSKFDQVKIGEFINHDIHIENRLGIIEKMKRRYPDLERMEKADQKWIKKFMNSKNQLVEKMEILNPIITEFKSLVKEKFGIEDINVEPKEVDMIQKSCLL